MCDYSLHNVASRPARVGEKLITAAFNVFVLTTTFNAHTRGFCAVGEEGVAICLRPGTELVFDDEVRYEHPLAFLTFRIGLRKQRQTAARFRQINLHSRYRSHDALEFADGSVVLMRRLCLGQHATVLQLPRSSSDVRTSANSLELESAGEPEKV